jgi:hypothetical protein
MRSVDPFDWNRPELSMCPGCGWRRRHDIEPLCHICELVADPREGLEGIRIAWDAFWEEREEAPQLLKENCFYGTFEEVWLEWTRWWLLNHDLRIPLVDRSIP